MTPTSQNIGVPSRPGLTAPRWRRRASVVLPVALSACLASCALPSSSASPLPGATRTGAPTRSAHPATPAPSASTRPTGRVGPTTPYRAGSARIDLPAGWEMSRSKRIFVVDGATAVREDVGGTKPLEPGVRGVSVQVVELPPPSKAVTHREVHDALAELRDRLASASREKLAGQFSTAGHGCIDSAWLLEPPTLQERGGVQSLNLHFRCTSMVGVKVEGWHRTALDDRGRQWQVTATALFVREADPNWDAQAASVVASLAPLAAEPAGATGDTTSAPA